MALIKSKKSTKQTLKITLDSELLEEIEMYCQFAELESKEEFFSESAKFVLSKDKEWKKYLKKHKKIKSKID